MIEDLQDESLQEIHGHQSRVKPLFNPYQKDYKPPASTSCLVQEAKQCRICLQSTDETDNPLIAPCRCMGTVKYIHQKCFRKWIENVFKYQTRQEQSELMDEGIDCELCKAKITLTFRTDFLCCRWQHFCKKFRDQPITLMLFICVFLIIITCEIFLGSKISQTDPTFKEDVASKVIMVLAMTFLGITALVIVYYCTKDYLLEKIWYLEGFSKKNRSTGRARNVQIIPLDLD